MRLQYSQPNGWDHGLSFLYMASWSLLSNLCARISPHKREATPLETVARVCFSHTLIKSALLEDADRKRRFKRILSFLFVEKKLSARKTDISDFDVMYQKRSPYAQPSGGEYRRRIETPKAGEWAYTMVWSAQALGTVKVKAMSMAKLQVTLRRT